MKTRLWVGILAAIFLLSCAASLYLLRPGENAGYARILSGGEVVRVVNLNMDQSFRIDSPNGYNIITVSGGKIAVTDSDCPDHYCQTRGYCSGGADIVCLPNKLVIQFFSADGPDAVVG